MNEELLRHIKEDCLIASQSQDDVKDKLADMTLSITGGTGFIGTWFAEMVAALNDKFSLGIKLHSYARNTQKWAQTYRHLSERDDVKLFQQDVRSPFEFDKSTNYIIHAAGIPNNRIHSSDALRVHQTTISGINNSLDAAIRLDGLRRFLNISSALVSGHSHKAGPRLETDSHPLPSGALRMVYADAKRSAEMLSAIYRSQYRLPVSIIRPFTFAGPFQDLRSPWAINNFYHDILSGREIRIFGDGSARRSYLYGSDLAWWLLVALVKAKDGQVYNFGSETPLTHLELIDAIGKQLGIQPQLILNVGHTEKHEHDDLFPDLTKTRRELAVVETSSLENTLSKTYSWFKLF